MPIFPEGFEKSQQLIMDPTQLLSEEMREFLEAEEIKISGAYVGMLRAYHNGTIWQTSASAPIEAAIKHDPTDPGGSMVDPDDLVIQLEVFVRILQECSPEQKASIKGRHVGLFEKGYLDELAAELGVTR